MKSLDTSPLLASVVMAGTLARHVELPECLAPFTLSSKESPFGNRFCLSVSCFEASSCLHCS